MIITTLLFSLIVFSELRNWYERTKLINKLMARNYSEYVESEISLKKANVPDNLERNIGIQL